MYLIAFPYLTLVCHSIKFPWGYVLKKKSPEVRQGNAIRKIYTHTHAHTHIIIMYICIK
jgi:hypothetical protein